MINNKHKCIIYRRRKQLKADKRRRDIIRDHDNCYCPAIGYIKQTYKDGVWCCGNHIQYPKNSNRQKYLKRLSNRRLRHYEGAFPKGNCYRKTSEYWWDID